MFGRSIMYHNRVLIISPSILLNLNLALHVVILDQDPSDNSFPPSATLRQRQQRLPRQRQAHSGTTTHNNVQNNRLTVNQQPRCGSAGSFPQRRNFTPPDTRSGALPTEITDLQVAPHRWRSTTVRQQRLQFLVWQPPDRRNTAWSSAAPLLPSSWAPQKQTRRTSPFVQSRFNGS